MSEEGEDEMLSIKSMQITLLSLDNYRRLPSSSLLMLIQAYLLKRCVKKGSVIESDLYGVIEIISIDPQESSVVSADTSISFYEPCQKLFSAFVDTISSNKHGLLSAEELSTILTTRLPGVESGIKQLCDCLMFKIQRLLHGGKPWAVSAGLMIQGHSGGGKTTILNTLKTFFLSKGATVTYLNCSSLLSERKRGESVAAVHAAMLPPTTSFTASSSTSDVGVTRLHIVLLDNFDVVFQPQSDSTTSVSLTATFANCIESLRTQTDFKGFVVATCTDTSNVPKGFLQLARFGNSVTLSYPTMLARADVALKVLTCSPPQVLDELLTHVASSSLNLGRNRLSMGERISGHVEDERAKLSGILSSEIARRTQGYSVLDLISSIKLSIGDAAFLHTSPATENFKVTSIDAFLDIITANKSSTALTSKSSVHIRDFTSSFPPPLPAGYTHLVNKIIRRTVHSDQEESTEATIRRKMGIKPCKGVIIYGPHGSGKTCLANRIAYEARSEFKFVSLSCAELVHKVVGESEKRLAELFRMARSIAPCFILLDNIEVILGAPSSADTTGGTGGGGMGRRNRSRTTHKAIDRILSTLLVELDGIEDPAEMRDHIKNGASGGGSVGQVVVIATMTSHPKTLDSALIRPGRLEEHIGLELPSLAQRREIVASLLSDECSPEGSSNSDDIIDLLAESTAGRCPADIIQVIQEASMDAIREHIRQKAEATACHGTITPHDLEALLASRKKHLVDRINMTNLATEATARGRIFTFEPKIK